MVTDKRPLTLDEVPEALLAEYGLRRGGATVSSYRCTDPAAQLAPMVNIRASVTRKLNEDAVRSLLQGIRDGADLPPIELLPIRDEAGFRLYHGMHRWRVSLALGFAVIPATVMSAAAAESLGLY